MRLDLTLLLVSLHIAGTKAWKCGIGPISGAVSYIIAFPSDSVEVDKCCAEHDTLIDGLHIPREEADRIFCDCLSSKDRWLVNSSSKLVHS
ncbi:hypothetical protein OSTOST_01580 [Ostertagia ostertagi]